MSEETLINTLLDSLVENLTSLIIKYEAIARDSARIEQKTDNVESIIKDLSTRIDSCLTELKAFHENLKIVIEIISKNKEVSDRTLKKVNETEFILQRIESKIGTFKDNNIEISVQEHLATVSSSLALISKFSELLRRPMTWIIIALTFIIAVKGSIALWEWFHTLPVGS